MEKNRREDCFGGQERVAPFAPLGRPMRQGPPEALRLSDKEVVREALRAGDQKRAEDYLSLFHEMQAGLIEILFEFALEWSHTAADVIPEREREITAQAARLWTDAAVSLRTGEEAELALEDLRPTFATDAWTPKVAENFRAERSRGEKTIGAAVLARVGSMQARQLLQIRSGNLDEAAQSIESYWKYVAAAHDALVQCSQSYPAAVLKALGQEATERLLHDAFANCSFFEGLWNLPVVLSPKELAAFLAEHLRAHFSGPGRGGSVQIVEEEDRYRLVFDACGSGGAMRRRQREAGQETEVMPGASRATWNLPAAVPTYCAHCAFNELESMKRFGYPVLVTEFDPDPHKPCGWSVYKDPKLIPEGYFRRIGFERDPSRFKTR